MSTQEVASKLVAYCRLGQHEQAMSELYSKDIVSIEPDGTTVKEIRGIEGVIQKSKQFGEMVETMHGMEVSDPCVADNFFSCSMKMDVIYKGAPRMVMEEIYLYQVLDGKIIQEEFFYTPMPS